MPPLGGTLAWGNRLSILRSPKEIDQPLDPSTGSAGYISYLDGVRAVAIMLVLLSHFQYGHIVSGDLGVAIFFVLSGFIITRTLFAQCGGQLDRPQVVRFYARRVFRLFPALLAYLACMIMFNLWEGEPIDWPSYFWTAIYLQNYAQHLFGISPERGLGHLWSLAVEEHFYLLYPGFLIAVGFGRRALYTATALLVAIIAWRLSLVYFAQDSQVPIFSSEEVYRRSDTRFSSILFGVVLILLTLERIPDFMRRCNRYGMWQLFVGTSLMVIPIWASPTANAEYGFGLAIQGIGIAIALNGVIFGHDSVYIRRLLALSPVVWIGRISYSLYIWHVAVFWRLVMPLGVENDFLRFMLGLCLSLAAAAASYYFMEQPIRRWGRMTSDRWFAAEPGSRLQYARSATDSRTGER